MQGIKDDRFCATLTITLTVPKTLTGQKLKVRKQTEHNKIPPVRPKVSGSGEITENISLYLEHHIKETSLKHP